MNHQAKDPADDGPEIGFITFFGLWPEGSTHSQATYFKILVRRKLEANGVRPCAMNPCDHGPRHTWDDLDLDI